MTYCEFVKTLPQQTINPNKYYHDHIYGFPVDNDDALFERMVLEINQAGLNWTLILNKQQAFRDAYANFQVATVAGYTEAEQQRLLKNPAIIRNKLKINAAIFNAQQILYLQKEYGSFKQWLDLQGHLRLDEWLKLFKTQFKFMGREIVNEFLMSCGYLKGAHNENCPIYTEVLKHQPRWMTF